MTDFTSLVCKHKAWKFSLLKSCTKPHLFWPIKYLRNLLIQARSLRLHWPQVPLRALKHSLKQGKREKMMLLRKHHAVSVERQHKPGDKAIAFPRAQGSDTWQHLFCAAAQVLHVIGRGKSANLSAVAHMGRWREKELPGSSAMDRGAEASIIHNGVNATENKHTWKLYLGFEWKPNYSLSVSLGLNLHHGYSVVHSFWELAHRGEIKMLISVWWMDQENEVCCVYALALQQDLQSSQGSPPGWAHT